jgi:hypothetical protein
MNYTISVSQVIGDNHMTKLKGYIQEVINYDYLTLEQRNTLLNYYASATPENAAHYYNEAQILVRNACDLVVKTMGISGLKIFSCVTITCLILNLLHDKYEKSSLRKKGHLVGFTNFIKNISGAGVLLGFFGLAVSGLMAMNAKF